jgi:hypothetical protein
VLSVGDDYHPSVQLTARSRAVGGNELRLSIGGAVAPDPALLLAAWLELPSNQPKAAVRIASTASNMPKGGVVNFAHGAPLVARVEALAGAWVNASAFRDFGSTRRENTDRGSAHAMGSRAMT